MKEYRNYLSKEDIEQLELIDSDNCLLMNDCDYEAGSIEEMEEQIRRVNEQRAVDDEDYFTINDITNNRVDGYCFSNGFVSHLEQEGFNHHKATLEELEDEANTLTYHQSSHHFI